MDSENQPIDGVFEELFPGGRLRSAFVDLRDLDPVLAEHPELTPAERAILAALRFEKRRRDWLGGRLAAKRAVLRLAGSGSFDWCPESTLAVEILPGSTREPHVYASGSPDPSSLQVSISHSGQIAGAVACHSNDGRIGFDMERVEPVEPALYSLAFLPAEIDAIESVPGPSRTECVHSFWTAKEAVSKAVGKGLAISLHDIELTLPMQSGSNGTIAKCLSARVRGNHDMYGSRFTIHTHQIGGYVLSLATPSLAGDQALVNQGRRAEE